jgi:hypothetical protein
LFFAFALRRLFGRWFRFLLRKAALFKIVNDKQPIQRSGNLLFGVVSRNSTKNAAYQDIFVILHASNSFGMASQALYHLKRRWRPGRGVVHPDLRFNVSFFFLITAIPATDHLPRVKLTPGLAIATWCQ